MFPRYMSHITVIPFLDILPLSSYYLYFELLDAYLDALGTLFEHAYFYKDIFTLNGDDLFENHISHFSHQA